MRRMLVAVDFSVWSRQTARYACETARAIGGTLTLLHVLEDPGSGPSDLDAAQTLLRELSGRARRSPTCLIVPAGSDPAGSGLAPDGHRDGDRRARRVALAILAAAESTGAELILIGPHGQGHPDARALGQVVQQVLLDARVPIQVVPCRADTPATGRWSRALAEHTASPRGLLHQPPVSTHAADGTRKP